MITRQRAFDLMQSKKSQYDYMIECSHIEDRANAEACRIGCRAWQEIGVAISNPEVEDINQFVRMIIEEIQIQWNDYIITGIPKDTVALNAEEAQAEYRQEIAEEYKAHGVQPIPLASQPAKKGKKQPPPPEVDIVPEPSKVVPGKDFMEAINPDAIGGIIDEIKQEVFGEPDAFTQAVLDLKAASET